MRCDGGSERCVRTLPSHPQSSEKHTFIISSIRTAPAGTAAVQQQRKAPNPTMRQVPPKFFYDSHLSLQARGLCFELSPRAKLICILARRPSRTGATLWVCKETVFLHGHHFVLRRTRWRYSSFAQKIIVSLRTTNLLSEAFSCRNTICFVRNISFIECTMFVIEGSDHCLVQVQSVFLLQEGRKQRPMPLSGFVAQLK